MELDTNLINTQLELAEKFIYYNLDTVILYSDLALNNSLQIQYKKGIANAYRLKGTANVLLHNYHQGDSLLNIAMKRYIEIDDLLGIIKSYNNLAIGAFYIGENQQALDYYNKAYKIAEKNNFKKDKAICFNIEISQQQKILNIFLIAFILSIAVVVFILIQYKKKNNAYKYLVKKNLDLLDKEEEVKKIKRQIQASSSGISAKTFVSDDDKEKIIKKLEKLFDKEKFFTKHDLTLEKLAKRLSTNRVYLSQIINDKYKKKYTDFINEYRIKEAMSGLSDHNKIKLFTIESIAKESGFISVSSFNPVFKKYTGLTPSKFRQTVINKINI